MDLSLRTYIHRPVTNALFTSTCHQGHISTNLSPMTYLHGPFTKDLSEWTCHHGPIYIDLSQRTYLNNLSPRTSLHQLDVNLSRKTCLHRPVTKKLSTSTCHQRPINIDLSPRSFRHRPVTKDPYQHRPVTRGPYQHRSVSKILLTSACALPIIKSKGASNIFISRTLFNICLTYLVFICKYVYGILFYRLRTIVSHTLMFYVLLLIYFFSCDRLSHLLNKIPTYLLTCVFINMLTRTYQYGPVTEVLSI